MRVKYTGSRNQRSVFLPIGAKTRGTIKQTLLAAPYIELSDADAKKLVALCPAHFQLAPEPGLEIHEDPKPPVKKPGRPRKDSVA